MLFNSSFRLPSSLSYADENSQCNLRTVTEKGRIGNAGAMLHSHSRGKEDGGNSGEVSNWAQDVAREAGAGDSSDSFT